MVSSSDFKLLFFEIFAKLNYKCDYSDNEVVLGYNVIWFYDFKWKFNYWSKTSLMGDRKKIGNESLSFVCRW